MYNENEIKEILKENLTPKRYNHSLEVAKEARRLALKYGCDDQKAYFAGLLRNDCSEKPAYKVLDRLINKEWNTTLEENVSGLLRFSGFYGEYDIEAEYQGKKSITTVNLTQANTGYDNRLCDFRVKEIIL